MPCRSVNRATLGSWVLWLGQPGSSTSRRVPKPASSSSTSTPHASIGHWRKPSQPAMGSLSTTLRHTTPRGSWLVGRAKPPVGVGYYSTPCCSRLAVRIDTGVCWSRCADASSCAPLPSLRTKRCTQLVRVRSPRAGASFACYTIWSVPPFHSMDASLTTCSMARWCMKWILPWVHTPPQQSQWLQTSLRAVGISILLFAIMLAFFLATHLVVATRVWPAGAPQDVKVVCTRNPTSGLSHRIGPSIEPGCFLVSRRVL